MLLLCMQVSPKMRVEELRNVIRDVGGILPALQRLSYAGERLLLQACCLETVIRKLVEVRNP